MKIGDCNLFHPNCNNGIDCKYLISRNCVRKHPKEHYIQTEAAYLEILRKREAKGTCLQVK